MPAADAVVPGVGGAPDRLGCAGVVRPACIAFGAVGIDGSSSAGLTGGDGREPDPAYNGACPTRAGDTDVGLAIEAEGRGARLKPVAGEVLSSRGFGKADAAGRLNAELDWEAAEELCAEMGRKPGIGDEVEGTASVLVPDRGAELVDVTGAAAPASKPSAAPLREIKAGGRRCSDDEGASEAGRGVGRMGRVEEGAGLAAVREGSDACSSASRVSTRAEGAAARELTCATGVPRFDEFVEPEELPK